MVDVAMNKVFQKLASLHAISLPCIKLQTPGRLYVLTGKAMHAKKIILGREAKHLGSLCNQWSGESVVKSYMNEPEGKLCRCSKLPGRCPHFLHWQQRGTQEDEPPFLKWMLSKIRNPQLWDLSQDLSIAKLFAPSFYFKVNSC